MSSLGDLAQLPLVERLGWVLVHSLWQGAAAGLLLALALSVMRRASSSARYLASGLALALLAAAPVVTFVVLKPARLPDSTPLVARAATPATDGTNATDATRKAERIESAPTRSAQTRAISAAASPVAATPARRWPPDLRKTSAWIAHASPWLVGGWLAGVIVLSLRLIVGWVEVQGLKRRHTSPVAAQWQQRLAEVARKTGVSKPVRLLESALAEVPLVIGWLRPVILLPASVLTGLSAQQLEALLAHELAHIRRHDYLVNLLQSAIETVLFYHPVVWWVGRRIRDERENACDDLAVQACGDRLTYARALTVLEEMRGAAVQLAPAASGGSLLLRIRRLVGLASGKEPLSSWWAAGFVAALVAIVALTGIITPTRAAAEKPTPRALSGSVVNPNGSVVADARVTLVIQDQRVGDVAEFSRAQTDTEGRFQLDLPRPGQERLLFVWAEAPGFAPATDTVSEDPASAVKLKLEEPTSTDVRMLDAAGQPLAGVRVQPESFFKYPYSLYQLPLPMAGRFAQTTDAKGIARLTGLPRDARLAVQVADPRFAALRQSEQTIQLNVARSEPHTVKLTPGVAIRGRVRFAGSGKPVPGAWVVAGSIADETSAGIATTDADGRYELLHLRPSTFNVGLMLDRELEKSWTARAHEKVIVEKGEQRDGLDFELVPGVELTGKVAAADNAEPLADFPVGVYGPAYPRSGGPVQRIKTDREGRYTLRVLPGAQHVYLMSQPPGFLPPAPEIQEITIREGETAKIVDFKLQRVPPRNAAFIRVLDADGRPVPDAEIHVNIAGEQQWDWLSRDAAGSPRIDVKDFTKPPRVRARHGDTATVAPVSITSGGELTLTLQQNVLGRIRGKVADAKGQPLADAKLSLFEWVGDGATGRQAATTDKDGGFDIRNAWSGAMLSVEATAPGWTKASSEHFTLVPGETRDLPPIVLKPATLSVAGRVVNEKGAPIPGFYVHVQGHSSPFQDTTTDREGRFHFENLANETVTLVAGREDNPSATARCQAGKTDIEIVAKSAQPLSNRQGNGSTQPKSADAIVDFPRTVADRFALAAARRKLSFLDATRLDSLRQDVHSFVARIFAAKSPPARLGQKQQAAIVEGIDDYVVVHLDDGEEAIASQWSDIVETFKWKVWLAMQRPSLDETQRARLEGQREALRSHIKTLPGAKAGARVTHERILGNLEDLFKNPLWPVFQDPMTDSESEEFNRLWRGELANLKEEALEHAVEFVVMHAFMVAFQADKRPELPPGFGKLKTFGSSGAAIHLKFAPQSPDETAEIVADRPAPKLPFLADVPEFGELDLTITEEALKAIIRKNGLLVRVSDEVTGKTYHVYRKDGENVIVMFRDGKCSGVQRMQRDPVGVPSSTESGQPASKAGKAFLTAWQQVRGINHSLLKGAERIAPKLEEDERGLRRADVSFSENASLGAKQRTPAPINAAAPYVYINASLQRRESGVPSQPTADALIFALDGTDYQLILTVGSSEPALAKQVTGIFGGAFPSASSAPIASQHPPQFPPPRVIGAERDRALADADKTLRERLLKLSKKFPQLQKTDRSSLEKLLAEPSPSGTVFIAFQWPSATKAGPTMEVPKADRYQISAILRPPSAEPAAAADFTSYPSWGLIGHFHAEAGDPALEQALTDLLQEAFEGLGKAFHPVTAPAPPHENQQGPTQDYTKFASLPDAEKEQIVWKLFDQNAFGKPEHKPICRDLLATQGRYCNANASGFTSSAIALAQKQDWTEMRDLIDAIFARPTDLWLCQGAFEYLRAVDGKPAPEMIVKAADTLRRAGQDQSLVRDAELNNAKEQLRAAPDKEAVLVHLIMVACTSRGKGGTERGIDAAVDVLKSLDRQTVGTRLAVLQIHLREGQRDEIERLRDRLDLNAREPWGEATNGVQASLRPDHLEWWRNEKPSLKLSLRNRGESSPLVARQQELAEVEIDGQWYEWSGEVDVFSIPLAPGVRFDDFAIVLDPSSWSSKDKHEQLVLKPGWHTVRVSMGLEGPERPTPRAVSNAIRINVIGILEPVPPNPDGRSANQWSRPSNGLIITARPSKPRSMVGENVVVVFTFKNFSDQPLIHLDAEDKTRATFHQFTFTDEAGKDIAFESPSETGDQLVRTTIPPGGSIERIVWLNPWKLAGLGHPYTPIGNEPRSFRVTAIYRTPEGLDLKDPQVWLGSIAAPPVRIEIGPSVPLRIKSPPLSEDKSPAAVGAARSRGAATAEADIAAGRPVIVYHRG